MSDVNEIKAESGESRISGLLEALKGLRFEPKDNITEFLKKRDEDLNITLIVAGLLSAVISAFIVYIQPELRPDPNEDSAALLRVLLYKMDNTTFGDEIPEIPRWAGPPSTIIATQALLFLSLSATLASVLFAILAKQLLDLYALAGSPGSDIEQGQVVHHSRLRWFTLSLHLLLLALSSMVQAALMLSSCALSVYLWNINIVIAVIVLVAASCALPFYFSFGILALTNIGLSHIRASKMEEKDGYARLLS